MTRSLQWKPAYYGTHHETRDYQRTYLYGLRQGNADMAARQSARTVMLRKGALGLPGFASPKEARSSQRLVFAETVDKRCSGRRLVSSGIQASLSSSQGGKFLSELRALSSKEGVRFRNLSTEWTFLQRLSVLDRHSIRKQISHGPCAARSIKCWTAECRIVVVSMGDKMPVSDELREKTRNYRKTFRLSCPVQNRWT